MDFTRNATKKGKSSYIDYPQNKKAVPPDWMLVKYTFVKIYIDPEGVSEEEGPPFSKLRKKSFGISFDL